MSSSYAYIRTNTRRSYFIIVTINIGFIYLLFSIIIVVGSANAVNITDGLDGLAIAPIIIVIGILSLISYNVGCNDCTKCLNAEYIPGSQELFIINSALIGSSLGFLWYNAQPATIFMGDTGSLSLGVSIGVVSLCIKHEIILIILSGLFLFELLSIVIQIIFFKIKKMRIFLITPIHHHLEQIGWNESKIVIRFWIISIILSLITLEILGVC